MKQELIIEIRTACNYAVLMQYVCGGLQKEIKGK